MKILQFSPSDNLDFRKVDRTEFVGFDPQLDIMFDIAEKAEVEYIKIPELRRDANFVARGIILATAIEVSKPVTVTQVTDCLSSDGSVYMLKDFYSRLIKTCLTEPDEPRSRTMSVGSLYSGREFRNRTIVI